MRRRSGHRHEHGCGECDGKLRKGHAKLPYTTPRRRPAVAPAWSVRPTPSGAGGSVRTVDAVVPGVCRLGEREARPDLHVVGPLLQRVGSGAIELREEDAV